MYPFVSLCTPTFNRRHFFPTLIEMIKLQTYPQKRMEWIVVDDGSDPVEDLINSCGIKNVRYVKLEKKLSLGAKRNLMHTYCKGAIIVYVDDDDFLPPERVEHSVETLLAAKKGELIAGSSEIYLFFKDKGLYQFGPYGPNHATAGTFAFKSELLKYTKYDETKCIGEETSFLKEYTLPLLQLNPVKTILVFPHEHNSFDKHTLLESATGGPIKPCTDKTVDDFIKSETVKDFFINRMHNELKKYDAGLPIMKPDVILQTLQIQINRNHQLLKRCFEQDEILKQQQIQNNEMVERLNSESLSSIVLKTADGSVSKTMTNQEVCQRLIYLENELQNSSIMMQQPDGRKIPITPQQCCQIMKQQQEHIEKLNDIIVALKNTIE
jgi:glycosyltransferase involved in cell wall biosynthesis